MQCNLVLEICLEGDSYGVVEWPFTRLSKLKLKLLKLMAMFKGGTMLVVMTCAMLTQ
jgi:hypothetical protein